MKKSFKYILCSVLFVFGVISFIGCEDADSINGYTLKEETLVDTCALSPVEGYYVGKGTLDGKVHYIFQGDKNGQKSQNIDTTEDLISIEYLSDTKNTDSSSSKTQNPSTEKTALTTSSAVTAIPLTPTVKAYDRIYVKGKDIKHKYYYKLYIPKNGIKDVGELSTSSSDDSEDSDE